MSDVFWCKRSGFSVDFSCMYGAVPDDLPSGIGSLSRGREGMGTGAGAVSVRAYGAAADRGGDLPVVSGGAASACGGQISVLQMSGKADEADHRGGDGRADRSGDRCGGTAYDEQERGGRGGRGGGRRAGERDGSVVNGRAADSCTQVKTKKE